MREIKFRGLTEKGTWVYGNLVYSKDAEEGWKTIIIPQENSDMYCDDEKIWNKDLGFEHWYRAVVNTIGQFTGLEDKNGKEIYEGDLCKELYEDGKETGSILQILWSEYYKFDAKVIKGGTLSEGLSFPLWHWDKRKENGYRQLEIIGNIYENPELLKKLKEGE